ncbi:pilus assembly protein HicB [Intrasporangium oryzae NRRL B-24470]|uniref:Pilus assembly protein HicB n=1 Tax=Intrasporangium oryzae NRRL B-24470 TaxID=1386089 RepID=W9G3S1_9MICO|nr:toxin-antitoxin system HicB family antitoxin [Intrasporangium oryzae]EWT00791.1 pilus assembly protein HicB [Intrasporangium oryzae NRRL B-24470]
MDITEYVEALRRDLAQAARAMGPDAEQAAERLGFAIDSSARLALMEALSQAAAEITNELDGAYVEVRLQGREPVFVVVGAGPSAAADDTTRIPAEGDTAAMPLEDEGEETARITLRIPEALKGRAEELAAKRGQSLNTWLVGAVRLATSQGAGTPFGAQFGAPMGPGAPGRSRSRKRVQGWVK